MSRSGLVSTPNSKRFRPAQPVSAPPLLLDQQQQMPNFPGTVAFEALPMLPVHMPTPPPNPRKRRPSPQQAAPASNATEMDINAGMSAPESMPQKKGRTNTPWTAEEELRLKNMRDDGKSWSEIAKTFPNRTEGSVKKHWYKDMHYAEFTEEESTALREAIKEYEASKWKVIGQKVGKPAKACEQYAKEHFKNL